MKIVIATQWFPGATPTIMNPDWSKTIDHSMNRFGFSSASAQKAIENKKWYAEKHGYDLFIEDKILDETRPRCWSKIKILQKLLEEDYDYIFWSDIDTLILNGEVKIEDRIKDNETKDLLFGSQTQTERKNTHELNCGNIIIKNTEWVKKFFIDVYNLEQFIKDQWPKGTEQRAVIHLISGKVPCIPQEVYKNMEEHIVMLDQHLINSYIDWGNGPYNINFHLYKEGDWIIHLAGVPDRDKWFDIWYKKWKEGTTFK